MTATFQPSRSDGRSDRQVLYDLCHAHPVETVWTHDELLDALRQGLDDPDTVTKPRLYQAVGMANRDLLRECHRYLSVVRHKGYRLIRSDEHLPVALAKKNRAQIQIMRGIAVLQGTAVDELSPTQRALHEGQLMIMSGLHMSIVDTQRRQSRADALLAKVQAEQAASAEDVAALRRRIDELESK